MGAMKEPGLRRARLVEGPDSGCSESAGRFLETSDIVARGENVVGVRLRSSELS